MRFRKNFHLAKKWNLEKTQKAIDDYSKKYPTPKWLWFLREMICYGFKIKVYEVNRSKYVFVYNFDTDYVAKVRFSNHPPIYGKQMQGDCDYYVGVSHDVKAIKTEEVVEAILNETGMQPDQQHQTQE